MATGRTIYLKLYRFNNTYKVSRCKNTLVYDPGDEILEKDVRSLISSGYQVIIDEAGSEKKED